MYNPALYILTNRECRIYFRKKFFLKINKKEAKYRSQLSTDSLRLQKMLINERALKLSRSIEV